MRTKCQFLAVLACLCFAACQAPEAPPVEPSPIMAAKASLEEYLEKNQEEGEFHYQVGESDEGLTAVLRNAAVGQQVNFATKDSTILLGVYQQDGTVYRSQLVRSDSTIQMQILNTANDRTEVVDYPFPDLVFESPGPGGFESLEDCMDHYFCTLEAIQCEANRTCEPQHYGIICCIEGEDICYSIHYYFPPTKPICFLQRWPLDPPILVAQH